MPESDAGHEQFEVEADVGIRAWGPTRAEAFAQAALGALALVADPATVAPREAREVRAQADGPETLLAAWIDECLYVHEIEAFVVSRVEVSPCSDTVVRGRRRCAGRGGRHRCETRRRPRRPRPAAAAVASRAAAWRARTPATPEGVVDSYYAPPRGKNGARIQTSERLRAAAAGLGRDNLD